MLLALQNVVTGFLRRTWLVALAALLACGSFAARAVAALQEGPDARGAVAVPVAAVAPPPAPMAAVSRRATPERADAFVARNIFCSGCAPPQGGGPVSTSYEGHPAVLIATSIGSEPRATVRVVPTEVQGSWAPGEEIPGVGKLLDIRPTSIEVADAAGHTKRISILGEGAGAATPGAPPPGQPGGEAPSPFADRVRKIDDSTFEVDRALIRELVTSASKPGMGGAVPMMKNGVVTGIRLVGITKTSPGSALELSSGDVITKIDGQPLQHVQMLLDLFARLETVSAVELGGTRRGKPLKRTLRLR